MGVLRPRESSGQPMGIPGTPQLYSKAQGPDTIGAIAGGLQSVLSAAQPVIAKREQEKERARLKYEKEQSDLQLQREQVGVEEAMFNAQVAWREKSAEFKQRKGKDSAGVRKDAEQAVVDIRDKYTEGMTDRQKAVFYNKFGSYALTRLEDMSAYEATEQASWSANSKAALLESYRMEAVNMYHNDKAFTDALDNGNAIIFNQGKEMGLDEHTVDKQRGLFFGSIMKEVYETMAAKGNVGGMEALRAKYGEEWSTLPGFEKEFEATFAKTKAIVERQSNLEKVSAASQEVMTAFGYEDKASALKYIRENYDAAFVADITKEYSYLADVQAGADAKKMEGIVSLTVRDLDEKMDAGDFESALRIANSFHEDPMYGPKLVSYVEARKAKEADAYLKTQKKVVDEEIATFSRMKSIEYKYAVDAGNAAVATPELLKMAMTNEGVSNEYILDVLEYQHKLSTAPKATLKVSAVKSLLYDVYGKKLEDHPRLLDMVSKKYTDRVPSEVELMQDMELYFSKGEHVGESNWYGHSGAGVNVNYVDVLEGKVSSEDYLVFVPDHLKKRIRQEVAEAGLGTGENVMRLWYRYKYLDIVDDKDVARAVLKEYKRRFEDRD